MKHCTTCGGEAEYLGALGRLRHFRCRNCGMIFSTEASSDDLETPDENDDE